MTYFTLFVPVQRLALNVILSSWSRPFSKLTRSHNAWKWYSGALAQSGDRGGGWGPASLGLPRFPAENPGAPVYNYILNPEFWFNPKPGETNMFCLHEDFFLLILLISNPTWFFLLFLWISCLPSWSSYWLSFDILPLCELTCGIKCHLRS